MSPTKLNLSAVKDYCKNLTKKELYELRGAITDQLRLRSNRDRRVKSVVNDAYIEIMGDDWSSLYGEYDKTKCDFYVYSHTDPLLAEKDPSPIYIGMGNKVRPYNFKRGRSHSEKLRYLLEKGYTKDDIVTILYGPIPEAHAREIEAKLILFWGLRVTSTGYPNAPSGRVPCLYNLAYEPYPAKYDTFDLCNGANK